MTRRLSLPFEDDNSSREPSPDFPAENQIVWLDSEEVYKPIPKAIVDFKQERGISDRSNKRVYIQNSAIDNLKTHLESNTRVEQGGILFGNAYEDRQHGIYVEITAAVAALSTLGTAAYLQFTSASWQSIMDYAEINHPEENIIGWYHSHPNLGVFMSGTDMRTQEAFFYHPWSVSIVRDPVRARTGYLLGDKAELVEAIQFAGILQNSWLTTANSTTSTPLEDKVKSHDSQYAQPEASSIRQKILIILLLIGIASIAFYLIIMDYIPVGEEK